MNSIRVLLADDHPVLRKGIHTILEMEDDIIVVGGAGDGEEALEQAVALKPDVLVLDVSMPKLSGVEVLKKLSEMNDPTRVLVLSAYDDESFIAEMVGAGAAGYLLKREALDTIVEAVRGIAIGETGWFSRAIINKMLESKITGKEISFTEREKELLHLLAKGHNNNQIGDLVGITERTVRYHLRNIYDKIGVNSRGMAIAWGVRHGYGSDVGT
jgi:DNA-binding NarL/FixJ family response regulator